MTLYRKLAKYSLDPCDEEIEGGPVTL
jgi:hypothetical protein